MKLKLLTNKYYNRYASSQSTEALNKIYDLNVKKYYSKSDFEDYIMASAVFSSNIEGNSVDADTYMKNKIFDIKSKPKEMEEIDDLISAYNFAMTVPLTQENMFKAHKILSKSILKLRGERGKYRTKRMGIISDRKLDYLAIEHENVKPEMNKLFYDIGQLSNERLNITEVFYYASLIHLYYEKIHPFMDGNGRIGRLLEKWFLATKLGKNAWAIQTERYYYQHRPEYYSNLMLGPNYYETNFDRSIPFLLMLPKSLTEPLRQK